VSPSAEFRTDLPNHSYTEEPFDILQPKDRANGGLQWLSKTYVPVE